MLSCVLLYTYYIHAIIILIIVMIIYLDFFLKISVLDATGECIVYDIECVVHGCLRKIIKKRMKAHTELHRKTVLDADYCICTHRDHSQCLTTHSI